MTNDIWYLDDANVYAINIRVNSGVVVKIQNVEKVIVKISESCSQMNNADKAVQEDLEENGKQICRNKSP